MLSNFNVNWVQETKVVKFKLVKLYIQSRINNRFPRQSSALGLKDNCERGKGFFSIVY